MARRNVRLDSSGIRALLKSREVTAATQDAAEAVAANAKAQGRRVGDRDGGPREIDMPVTVSMYETDRAHAVVALAHPAGDADQAKNGTLTKAAAEAGLDFKARG